MPEMQLIKITVAVLTAAFSFAGLLRLWLTYISWPTERLPRALGALSSLSVAVASWQLIGTRLPEQLYVLVAALLLLALWQVLDALRAIAGVTGHRIEVVAARKHAEVSHDHR